MFSRYEMYFQTIYIAVSYTHLDVYKRQEFYGAEQVVWVGDGIVGDDTDGHIDDITRFVNEDTVLTVIESNPLDENHILLQENYEALKEMRLRTKTHRIRSK